MTGLRVFADDAELGSAVAREIVDGIAAANGAGRQYLLGCPGGRSPRTTYAALAALVREEAVDLSHVVIVMMDDYVVKVDGTYNRVPSDLHCSVERFARVEILAPLNAAAGPGRTITDDRLWIPDPRDPGDYDTRLRDAGGIDLFILASGDSDGHVAFNPPGTPVHSRTRVIELAETTRRDNLGTFPDFTGLEDVPHYGISVGTGTISEFSRRAILVAPGASKREAVRRITTAREYDPAWPATVLVTCPSYAIYADELSAHELSAHPAEEALPPTWASTERNEVHT